MAATRAYAPHRTLLIDDDAYKAAANPSHTAIHPAAWEGDPSDTFLAPSGVLRTWLAGLNEAVSGGPPDALSGYVAAQPPPMDPGRGPVPMRAPMPADAPPPAAPANGGMKKSRKRRRTAATADAISECDLARSPKCDAARLAVRELD